MVQHPNTRHAAMPDRNLRRANESEDSLSCYRVCTAWHHFQIGTSHTTLVIRLFISRAKGFRPATRHGALYIDIEVMLRSAHSNPHRSSAHSLSLAKFQVRKSAATLVKSRPTVHPLQHLSSNPLQSPLHVLMSRCIQQLAWGISTK